MCYVEINISYLLFRCITFVCIDTYVSKHFYININMYPDSLRNVLIPNYFIFILRKYKKNNQILSNSLSQFIRTCRVDKKKKALYMNNNNIIRASYLGMGN